MNLNPLNCHAIRAIVASSVLAVHFAIPSSALAIVGGSTSDPGTFPWANVGKYGIGSTVFLGDINGNGTYWAITAYHNYNPLNTTVQFGSTYNIVAGSTVRLTNDYTGLSEYTDLMMFQVDVGANPSGLTTITLASTVPTDSNTLYMAGYGNGTKRWGSNSADSVSGLLAIETVGDVVVFSTHQNDGAQAEGGDSGGAVFSLNGSAWELTGIILAVGPSVQNGPVNKTYSASVAFYQDQILGAAIPEPGSMLLLATGLAGVLWHRSRRKKAA